MPTDLKLKRCGGCGLVFINLNPRMFRYCRDCQKLLRELQKQGLGLDIE